MYGSVFVNTTIFFVTFMFVRYRLDSTGNPVINSGYEFTISVRGSVKGDSMLQEVENVVMTAVKETIEALVEGRLA